MSMKYMNKYVDTVMVQSDTELDETSTNPIQNQAVAHALNEFNDYSLEETVIGTFLGKTLYRKVISYAPTSTIGALNKCTDVSIPHGISGIDRMIKCELLDNPYRFPVSGGTTTPSSWSGILMTNDTEVVFRSINTTWAPRTFYIIMEYTKK